MHLRRLVRSARCFGFRRDRRAVHDGITRAHAAAPQGLQRTRIAARHDWVFELRMAP